MSRKQQKPQVTFISQGAPIDEYGRALYAVVRSILRAYYDALSAEDFADINTPPEDVKLRQLAKLARIERDLGMRGDGFEWAVHEAIVGKEPRVLEPVAHAIRRASKFVSDREPSSLLFGQERAKYLGFVDAVVDQAGTDAYLLPEGRGRPFQFGPWVATAALGHNAEPMLPARIKQIWKTDLFLGSSDDPKYFATTVKSNYALLEGGRGLRIGIVPESSKKLSGVKYDDSRQLWIVSLADPDGFMGLFNDAYFCVARSLYNLAKRTVPSHMYFVKPSAKAVRVQEQLEKYSDALVFEVDEALNLASQQQLIQVQHQLLGVNPPGWLRMKQMAPQIIAPKPKFDVLD